MTRIEPCVLTILAQAFAKLYLQEPGLHTAKSYLSCRLGCFLFGHYFNSCARLLHFHIEHLLCDAFIVPACVQRSELAWV